MMTPEEFNKVLMGVSQRVVLQDLVDNMMKKRRTPVVVDKQILPTRVISQPAIETISPYGMIELNKYNEGVL